jgi:cell division protein FtsI (penicillin-binding protein 3)
MAELGGKDRFSNWRIYFLIIVFIFGFITILVRLLIIQVKDSWKYKDIAKRQYESPIKLVPERGNIYDRNLNTLVSNRIFYSFGADPQVLDDTSSIINLFSDVFRRNKSFYKEKLGKNSRFVWLERIVPQNIARQIDEKKFEGLIKIEEPRRIYLNNEICGQVLGCTNIDNEGLSGIELQFEKILHGSEGFMILQRNGLGKVNPTLDLPVQEPIDGNDIVLTLDLVYQTIVEEELVKGVLEFESDAGMALMMDPSNGAILALANYPRMDPNNYNLATPAQARNRVISDMFEPGSTIKLVTVSAALEEGVLKPEDQLYCENGKYKINGRIIPDEHPYGYLTVKEAVQYSSNIFMSKAVKLIGDEKFYKNLRNFGFGINTGIELPGEMKGNLRKPVEWSPETIISMSFGYGLSATVLQITAAYSAIANKGILMKPHIIDRIIGDDNSIIYQSSPQEIRRVVSEKNAKAITEMLKAVVENGTGKQAKIQGIDIAGKTGTARKVIDGEYSKQSHCASFVGFVPAVNSKFVLMILMDSPKKSYYGGEVSAPIFKRIVSRIRDFENLDTNENTKEKIQDDSKILVTIPNVNQLRFETAKNILEQIGFSAVKVGNGNRVIRQYPLANHKASIEEPVKLFVVVDSVEISKKDLPMPNVIGISVREAINRLASNYLNISIVGSGIVKSQTPLPGEKTTRGMKCRLICKPTEYKIAYN